MLQRICSTFHKSYAENLSGLLKFNYISGVKSYWTTLPISRSAEVRLPDEVLPWLQLIRESELEEEEEFLLQVADTMQVEEEEERILLEASEMFSD